MKNVGISCAALVIIATMTATTFAADLAVSKATLTSMGLGKMQLLSDNDGLAIRGMGTSASVWGEGTATFDKGPFYATETTGYKASASHHKGSSSAEGKNLAFAGKVRIDAGCECRLSIHVVGAVAGGFSSASAH